MTARVSVVVATRNRRSSLSRALDGVGAQSYRDFDVVVVDDGSGDDTTRWLRAAHPRAQVIELERQRGAAAARNRGVEASSGALLAFLDDDDVWAPTYLETQVAALDAAPEIDLSSTGHVEVSPSGAIGVPDLRPAASYATPLVHLLAECPLHTLSVVVCRRSAWSRIGPFDESLEIAHDLDWYARLLTGGGRRIHVATALVERGVPGGLVRRHRQWHREDAAVIGRALRAAPVAPRDRRLVRASRALLFARVGFTKGDLGFAFARAAEAFAVAPLVSVRVAGRRLLRHRRPGRVEAWNAPASEIR